MTHQITVFSHPITKKFIHRVSSPKRPVTKNRVFVWRKRLVADKVIPQGCALVAVPVPNMPYVYDVWAYFTGRAETASKFGFQPATGEVKP